MFPNCSGHWLLNGWKNWTEWQLKTVRFYLIEFFANFKLSSGSDPKPESLKTYIIGMQISFFQFWGYDIQLLSGQVFASQKYGLMSMLDNTARRLQVQGNHAISQNVLSNSNLVNLFTSHFLSN